MDWKAAMSSEIFREYVKNELQKEAIDANKPEEKLDTGKILDDFEKFEFQVKNTPHLKKAFAAIRERLVNDPEYRSKVDPDFANGVMLLSLDEAE